MVLKWPQHQQEMMGKVCALLKRKTLLDINHSCIVNTICFAREDFTFVCRAVTDIQEGEEDFWHFSCSCTQCEDRSELRTLSFLGLGLH